MDGLIAYALAKKYTDKVGQDIISAGFKVQVEDNRSILNRQGEEKVLYLLPKEHGSSQDGYDEFVYANRNWEWVGKMDVDLDYEELDNLPKINGVKLFGDKYHHQLKLFGCRPAQYKVERLETVLDLDESKNAISSVSISRSGYFPLSMNPRYRKIIVSDYQNPNDDGLVDILFWQDDDSKLAKMAFRVSPTGKYDYGISSWRELTGSAQIVSGVVNANGTITFTDSEGNSFTTSGSKLVTSSNEQISMGYDEDGFYFLFDDGQEEVNNVTD